MTKPLFQRVPFGKHHIIRVNNDATEDQRFFIIDLRKGGKPFPVSCPNNMKNAKPILGAAIAKIGEENIGDPADSGAMWPEFRCAPDGAFWPK